MPRWHRYGGRDELPDLAKVAVAVANSSMVDARIFEDGDIPCATSAIVAALLSPYPQCRSEDEKLAYPSSGRVRLWFPRIALGERVWISKYTSKEHDRRPRYSGTGIGTS